MRGMGVGNVIPNSRFNRWDASRSRFVSPQSPFLDYASMELPKDVTKLYKLCAYFVTSNPVIRAAITRKARLPVTKLVVRADSPKVQEDWQTLLIDSLKLNERRVQLNMELFAYGRSAASVIPPFNKYFRCGKCGRRYLATAVKYDLDAYYKKFYVHCPKCGRQQAKVFDFVLPFPNGMRIRVWSPFELEKIEHGYTKESRYFVTFPTWFRNDIKLGRPEAINDTPQEIVEAILHGKKFRLRPDRLFLFEEPSAAVPETGSKKGTWPWGTVLSVLKDAFHLQLALKAEEVNLVTQMIPFKAFAPVPTGQVGSDPYMAGALDEWMGMVKKDIRSWLVDPGHIGVFPVPVQPVDTRGVSAPMLPHNEIMAAIDRILAGLQVARELIFGGASWSGSSVSMRVMENDFSVNQDQHRNFIEFVINEVRRYLRWPEPSFDMRPMISADDIQRISLYHQGAAGGMVSRKTFHQKLGITSEEEEEQIDKEAKKMAERQATMQAAMPPPPGAMPPQEPGQPDPQAPQQPGQAPPGDPNAPAPAEPGVPDPSGSFGTEEQLLSMVQNQGAGPETVFQVSQYLRNLAPLHRATFMQKVHSINPEFHRAVMAQMHPLSDSAAKPLPEKLPPRRHDKIV